MTGESWNRWPAGATMAGSRGTDGDVGAPGMRRLGMQVPGR
jgi:hypothetical protein